MREGTGVGKEDEWRSHTQRSESREHRNQKRIGKIWDRKGPSFRSNRPGQGTKKERNKRGEEKEITTTKKKDSLDTSRREVGGMNFGGIVKKRKGGKMGIKTK